MSQINLIIPMDRALHARLKLFAKANRTSMAELVRGVVVEILERHGVETADTAIPNAEAMESESRTAVGSAS